MFVVANYTRFDLYLSESLNDALKRLCEHIFKVEDKCGCSKYLDSEFYFKTPIRVGLEEIAIFKITPPCSLPRKPELFISIESVRFRTIPPVNIVECKDVHSLIMSQFNTPEGSSYRCPCLRLASNPRRTSLWEDLNKDVRIITPVGSRNQMDMRLEEIVRPPEPKQVKKEVEPVLKQKLEDAIKSGNHLDYLRYQSEIQNSIRVEDDD